MSSIHTRPDLPTQVSAATDEPQSPPAVPPTAVTSPGAPPAAPDSALPRQAHVDLQGPVTEPAAAMLAPPTTAGVRVARPQPAREARYFDSMIARLGLTDAIADGVVTREEAEAAGMAIELLARQAAQTGNAKTLDGYVELLGINAGSRPIVAIPKDELLNPKNSGDYLVIAPAALHNALLPLLNHRALNGHKVALVDPQAVYALYGSEGPEPLARFVAEARERWQSPKPRFLTLVGDSRGPGPTVPTFRLESDKFGHTAMLDSTFASDNPFGDVDGDGLPELAVGRLPVQSEADLTATVAKLIAYEALQSPGAWQGDVVTVDGDLGWGGLIARAADFFAGQEAAALPEPYAGQRVSFNRENDAGTTDSAKLHAAIGRGAILISYAGHGTPTAVQGISTRDMAVLHAKQGSPIVVLTACLTGAFDDQDFLDKDFDRARVSLAEKLATGEGPAVGVVAGSETTEPLANSSWQRVMNHELLAGKARTVGEAMVNAKRKFIAGEIGGWPGFIEASARRFPTLASAFLPGAGRDNRDAMLHVYNYFGDPATVTQRPEKVSHIVVPNHALNLGEPTTIGIKLPNELQRGVAYIKLEAKPVLEAVRGNGMSSEERALGRERNADRNLNRRTQVLVVPVVGGKLSAPITLPPGIPHGLYDLRITVVGDETVATGGVSSIRVGFGDSP